MRRLSSGSMHVLGVLSVAAMIFPFLWMIWISLRTPANAFTFSLRGPFTVSNYAAVFRKSARFFVNSLMVASSSALVSLLFGVPAGYGLSRFRFTGKGLVTYLVVVLRMFPPVLLAIGFFALVTRIRLFDTLLALVILDSLFTLPFVIWMTKAYFDAIPKEIDEAALVDGCSPFGALWRVVLPVSKPGIVAVTIYGFLLSWNEFMFALTFIQSNSNKLATVALSEIMGEWWTNYPELMAMTVLICIPIMLLFIAVQRYIVAGLAASAIKG